MLAQCWLLGLVPVTHVLICAGRHYAGAGAPCSLIINVLRSSVLSHAMFFSFTDCATIAVNENDLAGRAMGACGILTLTPSKLP